MASSLPLGWEQRLDPVSNHIDHNTQTTHWEHPNSVFFQQYEPAMTVAAPTTLYGNPTISPLMGGGRAVKQPPSRVIIQESPGQVQEAEMTRSESCCLKCGWSFNIIIWICLIALIIVLATVKDRVYIMLGVLAGMSFLGYTCTAASSPALRLVSNEQGADEGKMQMRGSLDSTPELIMYLGFYHYETRTRQVSHTDSKGHTYYKTETYQQKVTTFSKTRPAPVVAVTDKTEDITIPLSAKIIKVTMTPSAAYAADGSQERLTAAVAAFKEEHREHFDSHNDAFSSMSVSSDFHHEVLIQRAEPSCWGTGYFWLFHFLLCGMCYRSYVLKTRFAVQCTVVKEFVIGMETTSALTEK